MVLWRPRHSRSCSVDAIRLPISGTLRLPRLTLCPLQQQPPSPWHRPPSACFPPPGRGWGPPRRESFRTCLRVFNSHESGRKIDAQGGWSSLFEPHLRLRMLAGGGRGWGGDRWREAAWSGPCHYPWCPVAMWASQGVNGVAQTGVILEVDSKAGGDRGPAFLVQTRRGPRGGVGTSWGSGPARRPWCSPWTRG